MTPEIVESNKKKFISLLQSINRPGMDNVISQLVKLGFFTAPASTKYHGNYEGGLCEHSLNVYQQAMYLFKIESKLKPVITKLIDEQSVILASLLHDVCKADIYITVKKWRKDENNKWIEKEEYDHDYSRFPIGHGEKSVIFLLKNGLELKDSEMLAIRWHMGAWDLSEYYESKTSYNKAGDICPLVSIIHTADTLASRIIENDYEAQ